MANTEVSERRAVAEDLSCLDILRSPELPLDRVRQLVEEAHFEEALDMVVDLLREDPNKMVVDTIIRGILKEAESKKPAIDAACADKALDRAEDLLRQVREPLEGLREAAKAVDYVSVFREDVFFSASLDQMERVRNMVEGRAHIERMIDEVCANLRLEDRKAAQAGLTGLKEAITGESVSNAIDIARQTFEGTELDAVETVINGVIKNADRPVFKLRCMPPEDMRDDRFSEQFTQELVGELRRKFQATYPNEEIGFNIDNAIIKLVTYCNDLRSLCLAESPGTDSFNALQQRIINTEHHGIDMWFGGPALHSEGELSFAGVCSSIFKRLETMTVRMGEKYGTAASE